MSVRDLLLVHCVTPGQGKQAGHALSKASWEMLVQEPWPQVSPDAFWKHWWWSLEICISIQHRPGSQGNSLNFSKSHTSGSHPHPSSQWTWLGLGTSRASACSVRHSAAASQLYKASTVVTLAPAETLPLFFHFELKIKTRVLKTKPFKPIGPCKASPLPTLHVHLIPSFPALSELQANLQVQKASPRHGLWCPPFPLWESPWCPTPARSPISASKFRGWQTTDWEPNSACCLFQKRTFYWNTVTPIYWCMSVMTFIYNSKAVKSKFLPSGPVYKRSFSNFDLVSIC